MNRSLFIKDDYISTDRYPSTCPVCFWKSSNCRHLLHPLEGRPNFSYSDSSRNLFGLHVRHPSVFVDIIGNCALEWYVFVAGMTWTELLYHRCWNVYTSQSCLHVLSDVLALVGWAFWAFAGNRGHLFHQPVSLHAPGHSQSYLCIFWDVVTIPLGHIRDVVEQRIYIVF